MKFDKDKIVSIAKYYIDEFCLFMYFLCCDNKQPRSGLLAIVISVVMFLVVPMLLILLLQGIWAVFVAIFTNPLATFRVAVTASLIIALPIIGLVICYKHGRKLKNADEDNIDEIC